MVTIIGIIIADLIVLALFAYQYRQELGFTVNGSYDLPVVRKKSAKEAARDDAAREAKRGQIVPAGGPAGSKTVRRGRRNAEIGPPRQRT